MTALQLDVKLHGGVPLDVLEEAIHAAARGRAKILAAMEAAIPAQRAPTAPAFGFVDVPPAMLGRVIGTGGTTLRETEDACGARLDVDEGGAAAGRGLLAAGGSAWECLAAGQLLHPFASGRPQRQPTLSPPPLADAPPAGRVSIYAPSQADYQRTADRVLGLAGELVKARWDAAGQGTAATSALRVASPGRPHAPLRPRGQSRRAHRPAQPCALCTALPLPPTQAGGPDVPGHGHEAAGLWRSGHAAGQRCAARGPGGAVECRAAAGLLRAAAPPPRRLCQAAPAPPLPLAPAGLRALVHISEVALQRVRSIEDALTVGQEVEVLCIGRDAKGQVKLSRKAVLARTAARADAQRSVAGGGGVDPEK